MKKHLFLMNNIIKPNLSNLLKHKAIYLSFFQNKWIFLQFLKKCYVFEPLIHGRRPPDHRIKILEHTKHYSWPFESWNYIRIWVPRSPGQMLFTNVDFDHFWAVKDFWEGCGPPETRRQTHKKIWRVPYYCTLKHPTIMLGWSNDSKGSSQKKSPPPPKTIIFGGGWTKFFRCKYSMF